ncbi:hypothetical protein ABSZL4_22 [Acinetobacter phage AB_SZL4]|uniref:Uncharacterized protein n=2 Tax=Obolenskvirus TaxID=1915205 RepID=A0A220NQM7_9CAUD|nr:hypothetical protein [Escherichia coli]YP_009609937.1 hypothetical protein FDI25_gp84 [Acinetobacter phage AbP2]AYP69062.1 hypothetical protein [Acinetobacter phage vB_AbaM_IME512]URY98780.1 hypothetical protein Arbor_66 [Acinetobacter phage Arbor]WHB31266.1 hypothetical protein [Acinetobacter phage P1068]WPJ68897.1 hypothetical protein ABSZL4_22 [Acinetobacter phage AB_SZL4]ASJ78955.1 hypothetical protein ABP2_084 [Acinetobacter phage AbP2]
MKIEFVYISIIIGLVLFGIFTTHNNINDIRLDRCKGKDAGTPVMVYGRAYTCTGN